jgi:hypothetical protein
MKKDVAIGMPVYDGRVDVLSAQQMHMGMYSTGSCVNKIIYEMGDSHVARARNKVATRFLKQKDCDYLMWIDSDIRFDVRLINKLREREVPVIGGVYLKKKLPYEAVLNTKIGEDGDLLKVKEVGTGFLMIHRDVLTAIKEAEPEHEYDPSADEDNEDYYDWFRSGVVNRRWLSEDYYFCHLARKYGFDIFVEPSIVVGHVGKMEFPLPNETDLINGATELISKYHKEAELDMEALDRLEAAINMQREVRK